MLEDLPFKINDLTSSSRTIAETRDMIFKLGEIFGRDYDDAASTNNEEGSSRTTTMSTTTGGIITGIEVVKAGWHREWVTLGWTMVISNVRVGGMHFTRYYRRHFPRPSWSRRPLRRPHHVTPRMKRMWSRRNAVMDEFFPVGDHSKHLAARNVLVRDSV